jgi:hypothetical protein
MLEVDIRRELNITENAYGKYQCTLNIFPKRSSSLGWKLEEAELKEAYMTLDTDEVTCIAHEILRGHVSEIITQ